MLVSRNRNAIDQEKKLPKTFAIDAEVLGNFFFARCGLRQGQAYRDMRLLDAGLFTSRGDG